MKNKKLPHVLASYWDTSYGMHPSLVENEEFYKFHPLYDEMVLEHLDELPTPLVNADSTCGHNIARDCSTTAVVDVDPFFCISPLFVKDLAGRIIYIGYGPDIKNNEQWDNNKNITFPKNCINLDEGTENIDALESIYLARFRAMDITYQYREMTKEEELNTLNEQYKHLNLYPYKLRMDSFYIDGWKLPQTELLYAKNVKEEISAQASNELLDAWKNKSGTSYEEFIESQGGDAWTNTLFNKGCTLIPTFEATNGYNEVGEDFSHLGNMPGRAVTGLHQIKSIQPSDLPKGTIIEVLEPGYITYKTIKPAQVIVSDGKEFNETYKDASNPLIPDLRLPHTRCSSTWGACWLPTKPHHFFPQAIWGWDEQTGKFLQLKGPLWDPLHYHYESVDYALAAFKKPLEENQKLAYVSEEVKARFFPVSPMHSFDITSPKIYKWRKKNKIYPLSGINRIPTEEEICGIGYHPIPIQYEFELYPFHFPELAPEKRVEKIQNHALEQRICPTIISNVTIEMYSAQIKAGSEQQRLKMSGMLANTTKIATKDYPFLARHLFPLPPDSIKLLTPVFVEFAPINLNKPLENLSYGIAQLEKIHHETKIPYYKAVVNLKEAAAEQVYLHAILYYNHGNEYQIGLWHSLTPEKILEIIEKRTQF